MVSNIEYLYYLIGFIFAIIVPYYPIDKVVNRLWSRLTGGDKNPGHGSYYINLAGIIGCVERTIYITSFILGKSEFIGVWLALKVAGQWDRWKEDNEDNNVKIVGRNIFNVFLIGSALSIMYAIAGAKLIEWLINGTWILAIGVPLLLLGSTCLLWYRIRPKQ